MPFDATKWYKRTSLMYAMGMWTVFGACVYYTTQKYVAPVETSKEEKEEEKEDTPPNVKIFKSAHTSTIATYRENFVPYSTRFLNLFRPTVSSSSGRESVEK